MPQEVILSRDQNKTAMPQYISRDLTNIEQMVLVPWEIENEDLGRIVLLKNAFLWDSGNI